MTRYLWLVTALVTISFASVAHAADRVALVIGNSSYSNVPALKNPSADSLLVADALKKDGFNSITMVRDAGRAGFEAALRAFAEKSDGADVALVYYAGHGIEVRRENFLIPTDARLLRDRDLEFEAIALDKIRRSISGAKLRLIILDACRDNPFTTTMKVSDASRSASRGLARIEPDEGELIVYAAKDGKIAMDGTGENSPFATAFARYLAEPGLEISLLFRKVRDDVLRSTGGEQEPYTYGSLPGTPTYLGPRGGVAPARAQTTVPPQLAGRSELPESRVQVEPIQSSAAASLCQARMISISHPTVEDIDGVNWYTAINGVETVRLLNCDSSTGQFATYFPYDAGSLDGTSGMVNGRRIAFDFGYAMRGGYYRIRCSAVGTAVGPKQYKGTISCDGRKTPMTPQPATIEF